MNLKNLLFLFLAALLTTGLRAQELTVRGTVLSEEGEPLAGVAVTVRDTSRGEVTDDRGAFTLKARRGDVLVCSFLGYKTRETTVTGATLRITLENDAIAVEEVVAVGYGVQRKADLTGSVSTVKGDALLKAPTPNLANALAGKMTGVVSTQQSGKPGFDDPTFYIRGKSTFGDNSTLMLVDGVERSIGKLDPNEIESITVLKDAASAAIYGARAANGVILVTTRRGDEGRTRINYTGSFGFQSPTVIPEMMNAYEYAKYLNLAKVNIGQTPRFTEQQIQAYRTGAQPSTDWWKETLRESAGITQHSLSLNGGGKTSKFFISLGMLGQDGLYDLSSFDRYNVRANVDTHITRDLTVGVDLAGRHEKLSQSAVGDALFSTIINSKPTERPYVPDSVEEGALGSNGQNASPIGQAERSGYQRTTNSVFQGTLSAQYAFPFLKGLKIRGSVAYDRWFSKAKTFTKPYDFYIYDREIDLYTKRTSGGGISLYEGTAEDERLTATAALNYDVTLAGTHNLSALLLYEESSYKYSNLQASRTNYISDAIDQIFAGPDKDKSNGGSATQTVRKGLVGRLNYNYAGKYLFQFNFRYDGSFNFPAHKRWGFFPAVSAGWRLSEEEFLKRSEVFDNLKLRISYGEFGNDRVPSFQYLSGYRIQSGAVIGSGQTFMTGIADTGIPNPRITWESARNIDAGLDFSLLRNRLSGEVTYFYKKTRDILLPRSASVPQSFGATLPDENIGKVDNWGFEAVLRYMDRWGDFSLMAEANLTLTRSKVVYMDEPLNVADRIRRTGRPFDQFYGLKALGLFQTQEEIDGWADQDGMGNASIRPGDIKYADYDHNGVIDGEDIQKIGRSQIPQTVFGLNLGFAWKSLQLTANFQGATGFDQYMRWDPFNLESNALAIYKDSWTEQNRDARYPRLLAGTVQNNRQKSSFWLHDGTYVRLRNLELSYSFACKGWLGKAGVQGLRLFFSGNNLLTFSKIRNFDPESPYIDPDQNAYYYPQMKSYNFGLSIDF